MKQKALVSFGGPFPYDKSFRGQSIVEGDLIKEATSRGMKSLIVSKYHVHKDPLHEKTEAMQRMIAEMAFSSDIRFRYKADFCDARNKCNMAIKSMKQDAFGHWANFYGLNDVKKLIEAYGKVYYFMHYYNSRFMEAEYFSKVVMHEKLCNAINAYYFIHVAPDQLVESEKNGGWRDEENTGGAVQSLVTAMESGCFKAFVAVSQAARDMWIELIKSFGYARETVDTAEKKMIAVPNGIDANLYGSSYIMPGSSVLAETRARLGFDPSVEKIVLVMTRPSISKGIDRINETLAAFNASSDPKLKKIGFLVTMPETEGTEPFLERIREMESLVSGNRLKVTIDVSKVVRSRPELECEFNGIQTMMPISYRNEKFYIEPIGYPLTCVSDVFLHLPYAEAFGLVVAESLMSGCAVITTDAGGIPEVTKNSKDAILFDHEKVVIRDVVDAIAASERPMSPNGTFVQQFSLKSQFDKIVGDGND